MGRPLISTPALLSSFHSLILIHPNTYLWQFAQILHVDGFLVALHQHIVDPVVRHPRQQIGRVRAKQDAVVNVPESWTLKTNSMK
jgi:hypothetical protein